MRLEVKKLFGKYDYDITFDKKMNVLIGENGTGKSTLLKIISFILDNDYIGLSKIKFDYIVVEQDNKKMKISYKDLIQNDFTKDNNFIFAINDFFKQPNICEYINLLSNNDASELLFDDVLSNNWFTCRGKFVELLEKMKLYCIGKLKYKQFTFNPYDIEEYLEIDKSVYGITDIDNRVNYQLYDPIHKNYSKIKFVYGSNMYLKRLIIYYIYFIRNVNKTSVDYTERGQIWEKIYKLFNSSIISLPISFHNFVSYEDKNKYIYETANYNDKVNFYSLLSDVILEKANVKTKIIPLSHDEKDKVSKIHKEFVKMSEYKGLFDIFNNQKILEVDKDFNIFSVDCDVDEKRINPKDYFMNIYGKNIEIKFDSERYGTRIVLPEKHPILDPLVWFNRTFGDMEWFDYYREYNYYECYRNIANNYDKLMDCKKNINYINFKLLFSKYFINKTIDIIGEDIEIVDSNTQNKLNEDNLSSGEYKLLRILKMLCFSDENTILLLDEPELSLSIYWQEMLLEDILRYSKAKQIIIATQSPNLINEDQLEYLIEVKKEKGE